MSHLDILIPFGLPPTELSTDLLRQLKAPALAHLIARASSGQHLSGHEKFDAFARVLPHEAWLARQFGVKQGLPEDSSPPVATVAMTALGVPPTEGEWFILQPVHIHIAQDHLVLTDVRQLNLSDQDSRALFAIAQPLFEEHGKSLIYGNSMTWFVRADDWANLKTATPDAACGRNIDIWMPKGDGERNWRKVQNDVQMHWFSHRINAEREAHGLKPVNSVWLWGGATAQDASVRSPYSATFRLHGWMEAFGHRSGYAKESATCSYVIDAAQERALVLLDELAEPALAADWGYWLQAFQQLEADWFAPLLTALENGKLKRLSLIFTHNSSLTSCTTSRQSLRKFWVKPSFARLCP